MISSAASVNETKPPIRKKGSSQAGQEGVRASRAGCRPSGHRIGAMGWVIYMTQQRRRLHQRLKPFPSYPSSARAISRDLADQVAGEKADRADPRRRRAPPRHAARRPRPRGQRIGAARGEAGDDAGEHVARPRGREADAVCSMAQAVRRRASAMTVSRRLERPPPRRARRRLARAADRVGARSPRRSRRSGCAISP